MAAEVIDAQLSGQDHELSCFEPKPFGDKVEIAEDFEADMNSEPDLCEYTEDLFIK